MLSRVKHIATTVECRMRTTPQLARKVHDKHLAMSHWEVCFRSEEYSLRTSDSILILNKEEKTKAKIYKQEIKTRTTKN